MITLIIKFDSSNVVTTSAAGPPTSRPEAEAVKSRRTMLMAIAMGLVLLADYARRALC